ncbi:hypothetical protein EI94DRAFT_692097 [Lactarius quietus]|nr:hypothetical protein EI94DRAFT_692097 [Lactarius quietus]
MSRLSTPLTRALARPYATHHRPPVSETYGFLKNLFSDGDLIPLPFQSVIAPWIARRRTPRIKQQYIDIGGGSPILRWSEQQGEGMAVLLDELYPATAPHKSYVAFRYARPLAEETARRMKEDGVKRAIAFTQYPQYSCSTTGSSLNDIYRKCRAGLFSGIDWSVIDRWGTHPGFVEAVVQNIESALGKFSEEKRADAHSLPMSIVNRGDPYVLEVSATVTPVMDRLGHTNPYRLVWQSQVGPKAWMSPQTSDVLKCPTVMTWYSVSANLFPNGAQDLEHALVQNQAWAIIAINPNATENLNAALIAQDNNYLPNGTVTAYVAEARNENAYRDVIYPNIVEVLDDVTESFNIQYIATIPDKSSDLTSLSSLRRGWFRNQSHTPWITYVRLTYPWQPRSNLWD